jgi:hypothetical protein
MGHEALTVIRTCLRLLIPHPRHRSATHYNAAAQSLIALHRVSTRDLHSGGMVSPVVSQFFGGFEGGPYGV